MVDYDWIEFVTIEDDLNDDQIGLINLCTVPWDFSKIQAKLTRCKL